MSDEPTFTLSMSPSIGAIAAAMAKAQESMGPAAKDSTNPHFKSSYASLASCIEACKPLHKNGIAVFQPPMQSGPDGVCVATLLVHSSGEWIRGELYMPAAKRDPQGFGSALTYARRYCLCSTVGLGTDDDDGAEASKGRPVQAAKPAVVPTAPDPKQFEKYCNDLDAAETRALINGIALAASRAHKAGKITDEQHNTIVRAVTAKLGAFGGQTTQGGAA